ncbi:MAG: aspartate aminotransferase family protein [Candidatus Nanohaloarchaeota archaeon QJJ-7]|nr:aspartate aminotransferase family protein [Candidatus Nanohaloarchaeota archaeon QJJ-7]
MGTSERFERYVGRSGYYQDVEIERTEGNFLVGPEGEHYVDFVAGWCVVNAGYGRERILNSMRKHAEKAAYVKPTYVNEEVIDLAETLNDITPGSLEASFRTVSGTEAVETAIKAARMYTGKEKIVSLEESYHGNAYGAMGAGDTDTKQEFAPLAPGFEHIRPPEYGDDEWYGELEEMFREEDVAAFLSETVLTHQGVSIPGKEHYERLRELTEKHGVLLILDEVANGFGRTGEMFAADLYGVEPDMMTLAKGMSSGYAPVGATMMREDIGEEMSNTDMSAYSTFGWVPSAVGAAGANIEMIQDGLLENAEEKGQLLEERMMEIEGVREVRRRGLLLGVVLDGLEASEVRGRAAENNLLLGTTNQENVLMLSPPLNIDERYVEEGVERLRRTVESLG